MPCCVGIAFASDVGGGRACRKPYRWLLKSVPVRVCGSALSAVSCNSITFYLPSNRFLMVPSRFGTKRVRANQVYQEYISDKSHLHMNSTRWVTLTEFVKHLGRTGVARVDETEKGWFIAWIDSSPKALAKAVRQFFQAAVSISWASICIRKRL